MTREEQDRVIADMVRERRELLGTIVCLRQQISRAGDGFAAAAEAVRSSKNLQPSHRVFFLETAHYPDEATFRETLSSLESSTARLKEVETALDDC